MAQPHLIIGINIPCFTKNGAEIQKILTEYACNIHTRLGLHGLAEGVCSATGLILIEFIGDETLADKMITELYKTNPDVEIKKMAFEK